MVGCTPPNDLTRGAPPKDYFYLAGRGGLVRKLVMYAIRLSVSSGGIMRSGIVGCEVCSQTAMAVGVMPGVLAISVNLGALGLGE